jgi:hypothetical protein
MKSSRFAAALALGLVLFATALPAAAACCVGKPGKTAAMRSSMPCCNEICRTMTRRAANNHDVAMLPTPSASKQLHVAIEITALVSSAIAPMLQPDSERVSVAFSPPSPVVAQHQFRI